MEVLAVAFSVAVSDKDRIVARHVSTWNLVEGDSFEVVVLIALGPLMGRVSTTRRVIHRGYMNAIFVQFDIIAAADALNLVTTSFMDEANIELQIASAVMP